MVPSAAPWARPLGLPAGGPAPSRGSGGGALRGPASGPDGAGPCARRVRARTRASPPVAAQRAILDGDRARAHRVEQRAVVGDEQDRPLEGAQRVLERLAALDVEVVGGLVEDQHVGARMHEDRQRQAPALAAGEPLQRLLGLLAGEQEAPEQRARLAGVQSGRPLRRVEHALAGVAARAQLLGVLGEVADLHVVPGAELSGGELAPPGERLDQRRLARPVRPHQRDVLAALQPQLGVLEQRDRRPADLDAPIEQLEDHAPRALRARRTRTPGPCRRRGSRSMRSIFASFFTRDCAWRAFVAL